MTPLLGSDHSRPKRRLPKGACDCHVHVFGDSAPFPMSPDRSYTPPPATAEDLAKHQSVLGLDRVVVIQASIYGTDNRCMLDAIARLGSGARGVAVIDRNVTSEEIAALHAGGVRGIRLNLAASAVDDIGRIRSDISFANEVVAERNWHLQIFTELSLIAALAKDLERLSCDVVIDHFGRAPAHGGVSQLGFDALVELLSASVAYVKLSAPYLISNESDQNDVAPLVAKLVEVNSRRLLWGSNWPHPGGGTGSRSSLHTLTPFRSVDDGLALDRLADWVSDETILRDILVANPTELFGFEGAGEDL